MSLRRRLLLAFAAIAVVLAVADVVIIRTVDGSLFGQIDDRLSTTVPALRRSGRRRAAAALGHRRLRHDRRSRTSR